MAQFVESSIDVDGKSIKQFTSFTLTQSIFEHHAFRLVCPSEAIDGNTSPLFSSSRNMIGGSFSIQIKAVGAQGSLQFKGVVTQVEAARHSGHAGDIIISGYSPTILLDNGPHCKSWEKKAVKNIAQDVLKHFPQNLLQPKISPTYGETLAYTVQYKETAWQFLSRLSATYGEWFYYDGQKLVLGSPQGGKAQLIYGKELNKFNLAMQVRPTSFQMLAYDYLNAMIYDSYPSDIASTAGLNELGKHALEKSEEFYNTHPKYWYNHFLTNKKQLDDHVSAKASMQSSNLVRFNGQSGHPGLQLGGSATIKSKNVFNNTDEAFGDYTIVSVNHFLDGQGKYTNDFAAIPFGVKMPPITKYSEPNCETQSAIVTDNHDTNGLGRVRVKFHWMNDDERTPWIRVSLGHAGPEKGLFIIPEIGEEVIIAFEDDIPTKPYVIGSVYNGSAKCEFSTKGNDVKVLKTRSGNMIVLNDKSGSIHISDPSGNSILLHGNGEITISAPKVLTLKSKSINIAAEEAVFITGGGTESTPDMSSILVDPGLIESYANQLWTTAVESYTLEGKKATISIEEDLGLAANLLELAASNLNLKADSQTTITSADTQIF